MKIYILFIAVVVNCILMISSYVEASGHCSTLNFCRVEKTTWTLKGWKVNYVKTLKFDNFCDSEAPLLQLEANLGIQLSILEGDQKSSNPIQLEPHVLVDLFTHKLTYIVASGRAPLSATAINFNHRLQPKGSSFIEVTCIKK